MCVCSCICRVNCALFVTYSLIWDPAVLPCCSSTSGERQQRTWVGKQKAARVLPRLLLRYRDMLPTTTHYYCWRSLCSLILCLQIPASSNVIGRKRTEAKGKWLPSPRSDFLCRQTRVMNPKSLICHERYSLTRGSAGDILIPTRHAESDPPCATCLAHGCNPEWRFNQPHSPQNE